MKQKVLRESVFDLMKMFNHEFRTPLNIIIGLSDLMTRDMQSSREVFVKRQRLLRLCASVMLAIITCIVHQCELTWKLPTSLNHTGFHPIEEVENIVRTTNEKLQIRGNALELYIETDMPEVVWGNLYHFRRVLCFIIATCSNMTTHDKIALRVRSIQNCEKCTLDWELEAHCSPVQSFAEFHSILELLSDTEDLDSEDYIAMLQQADRQSLLNLSVAREMAKLLFGDLMIVESDHLALKFCMSFSMRRNYVLKRRGLIAPDDEEFLSMSLPTFEEEASETEGLGDVTPANPAHHYITHYFSEAAIGLSFPSDPSRVARRSHTYPSRQLFFGQLPFNFGDTTEVADSPGHDPDTRQVTALVADDVPSNALVLRDMLKHLGVTSAIVSNGEEAVDFVRNCVPDVIFMDCEMPVMGGLEATRLIRELRVTIPIVAVTANGPEHAPDCRAAGMNHFISKPVRMTVLSALLEQLHLSINPL
jgi:CheY-like chemotaxis protein